MPSSLIMMYGSISADLQKPNVSELIYAKQHDRLTRGVFLSVYNMGAPYTLPSTSSARYVVRALKPDGTICIYENDENDDPAVFIASNTASITIAQQALACPGDVKMELCVENANGTEILTTFSFIIRVEPSAIDGPASTNYSNPVIPSQYIKSVSVSQDGNTLSMTKQDNTTVNFSPTGGGGGTGGDIVYLTYGVTTLEQARTLFNAGKTLMVKVNDTIEGNTVAVYYYPVAIVPSIGMEFRRVKSIAIGVQRAEVLVLSSNGWAGYSDP